VSPADSNAGRAALRRTSYPQSAKRRVRASAAAALQEQRPCYAADYFRTGRTNLSPNRFLRSKAFEVVHNLPSWTRGFSRTQRPRGQTKPV
ncbi:MAG: hypothetical protein NZ739_08955, partial [Verrucomicrobiae bacterium]|nr:hypothetical protein [Verrucomicrobiae bacterium]